jgi:hypothetical protein
MKLDSKTDIERMTVFSKQVYEAAQTTIESMHDGDRIQIKQLAQVVGLALAKDPKDVLGFINYFAHDTSFAYVSRGKNGGLVKGIKPVKIVKPSKKQKEETVVVLSSDKMNSNS